MLFNSNRAVEYMRRCQVDVLVATSPTNVTYFSDYYCWLDSQFKEYMMNPGASSNLDQTAPYAIFPLEGEPALVLTPMCATDAADLWVRDLHIFGTPLFENTQMPTTFTEIEQRFYNLLQGKRVNVTPVDALWSILKTRGLTDARIGLEMEGLSPSAKAAIMEALPRAAIKDCSNLIRLIRMVKTDDELSRLTRAAEISEKAAIESLELAHPGCPIVEIGRHYRGQIAAEGAEFDHFQFGVRGVGMATASNYVLTDDDLLYVDFGCIYQQCFSDSGTTFTMRELPAPLLEKHAALRACKNAGVEVIRPSAKASAIQAAMWQTLNTYGITASFPHGHGLGLEVRDYPIIVADNGGRIRDDCVDVPSDLPLESDMVINLEAMVAMPGTGSLHIEQSFVVTPEGSRLLVSQDRTQPFQPTALSQ